MCSRNDLIIAISFLAILFTTPLHAQVEPFVIGGNTYADLMQSSTVKIDPDTVFRHIATRTYAENLEELFCYYEDRVHKLSPEELTQEIERMKQAARRYRSEKLEAEAEYFAAYPEESDPIAAMQPVLDKAIERGDL